MKDLSFLSLFRTKPGGKADSVPQPYNNIERLLKFRLARFELGRAEILRGTTEVRPNERQWAFKR